jgi:hypothetical protein
MDIDGMPLSGLATDEGLRAGDLGAELSTHTTRIGLNTSERFDTKEALEAHLASPHYQGIARDIIRPLLRDRSVEFYRVLPPASPARHE